jgi:hypothetical protein
MPDYQATTARSIEHDVAPRDGLTAEQVFELERSRADRADRRRPQARTGLRDRLLGRSQRTQAAAAADRPLPHHLRGLGAAGCVTLVARHTLIGRRLIDYLVVAPSGLYVVEERSWTGQVAVSGDRLFVDGRHRSGVPESVKRTAEAVHQVLADELSPVGLAPKPVLLLPAAEAGLEASEAQGMLVIGRHGLLRHLRRAEPVMGRDTVVRLALAADRLLER